MRLQCDTLSTMNFFSRLVKLACKSGVIALVEVLISFVLNCYLGQR